MKGGRQPQPRVSEKHAAAMEQLRNSMHATIPKDSIVSSTNGSGGEQYEGQVDSKNRRHGTGALRWPNGNYYLGQWDSGAMKGTGTFLYAAEDDKYEGEFQEDKKHGTGKYTFSNGNFYIGAFANDKRHGKGKYSWVCGDMYDGDWFEGRMQGHGTTVYSNGNKYVGEFLGDRRNGQGTLICTDGLSYSGEWLKNQRHGKGTLKFANGDFYEGEWAADKKHGRGVDAFENGNRFEGNYAENVKTGFGVMTYNNGDKYEGEWQEDRMHGEGEYNFSNGFRYKGNWEDDLRHGRGLYTFPSGHVYDGEWKNDKREGAGVLTLAPNGEEYRGRWVDGKMDGKFRINRRYLPDTQPLKEFVSPPAPSTNKDDEGKGSKDNKSSSSSSPPAYKQRTDLIVKEAYTGIWKRGQPTGEGTYFFYRSNSAIDGPPITLTGTWNMADATKKSDGTLEFIPQDKLQTYLGLLQIAFEPDTEDTGIFSESIDGVFTPVPFPSHDQHGDSAAAHQELSEIEEEMVTRSIAESYGPKAVQSLKKIASLNTMGTLADYAEWLLEEQKTVLAKLKEIDGNDFSGESLEKERALIAELTAKVDTLNGNLERLGTEAKELETEISLQQGNIATLRQSQTSLKSQVDKLKQAKQEIEKANATQGQILEKLEAARLKHENLLSEQEIAMFEKKRLKEEVDGKLATKAELQSRLDGLKQDAKAKDTLLKEAQQKLSSQGAMYRGKLKDISGTKKESESTVNNLRKDIESLNSFIEATTKELQLIEAAAQDVTSTPEQEEKERLLAEIEREEKRLRDSNQRSENLTGEISEVEEKLASLKKDADKATVERDLVSEELESSKSTLKSKRNEVETLRLQNQTREDEIEALQKQFDPLLNKLQMELESLQEKKELQENNAKAGGGGKPPTTPLQLERSSSAVGKIRGLRRSSSAAFATPPQEQDGDSEALVEMRKRLATAQANAKQERDQAEELQKCLTESEEEVKRLMKQEKSMKKALSDILEGKDRGSSPVEGGASSFSLDAGREVVVHQLIKARSKSEQLAKEKEKLLSQMASLEDSISEAENRMDNVRDDSINSIIASLGPDDWRLKYLVEQLEAKGKTIQELNVQILPIAHLEEQLLAVNDQIAALNKDSDQTVELRQTGSRQSKSASSFRM